MEFIELYDLREDTEKILSVQNATLNTQDFGLKVENGLLFGTEKWFEAINSGQIKMIELKGTITDVKKVGMNNDSREIEVTDDLTGEKSIWGTKGKWKYYQINKKVEIKYVIQKFKTPNTFLGPFSKCILNYRIEK
jgi:hypothetical protein